MKNVALIQEEVKKKNGRECQNGGEQRRRGGRETGKHTHTRASTHNF